MLVVSVVGAIISHWGEIDGTARIAFCGLAALGAYMVYRGASAKKKLDSGKPGGSYIDDVGFVLIALCVGLVIVPLLRLEAPAWVTVLVIALTIIIGNRLLSLVHRRNPADNF